MIKSFFQSLNPKIVKFVEKYNLPKGYLVINRKSISRALLIGSFIAFIPMPFQMALVLFFVPFIKFNVPVALSLVWLSNPITMPFMYYLEYKMGLILLNQQNLPDLEISLNWFSSHFSEIMIPLYTGTLFFSITISLFLFFFLNWSWRRSVLKKKNCKK